MKPRARGKLLDTTICLGPGLMPGLGVREKKKKGAGYETNINGPNKTQLRRPTEFKDIMRERGPKVLNNGGSPCNRT